MQEVKKPQAALVQLMAALVILGIALILRTFFPDATRAFLRSYVAGGMDYTDVLSDVGEGLRSWILGVPHPNEGAGEVSDEVSNESGETDDLPQETGTEEGQDPGLPDESQSYDLTGETYDPEHEPPPDAGASLGEMPAEDKDSELNGSPLAYSIGGFDQPVLWANADYFLSGPDGEDDTLPLPFGMQKPDRVDYTVYELPFETVRPVEGRLTSGFGYRIHPVYNDWRFHYGIDLAGDTGTPIHAFAAGTVAAVGVSSSYGNYIIVEHGDGYSTLYGHCKKVIAAKGDTVELGQKIAEVGNTGVTTGPHLHFEIRRGDTFLDPSAYINLDGVDT